MKESLIDIDLDCILPFYEQPREYFDEESLDQLAKSLREHQQIEPVRVSELEPGPDGRMRYRLIDGERRWRAAPRVPLGKLKAVVGQAETEDDRFLQSLLANAKETLLPSEVAKAVERVCGMPRFVALESSTRRQEVALLFGRKPVWIDEQLKIAGASALHPYLNSGQLTKVALLDLVKIEDSKYRDEVGRRIAQTPATHRAKSRLVKSALDVAIERKAPPVQQAPGTAVVTPQARTRNVLRSQITSITQITENLLDLPVAAVAAAVAGHKAERLDFVVRLRDAAAAMEQLAQALEKAQ